jgi:hypothetical protein
MARFLLERLKIKKLGAHGAKASLPVISNLAATHLGEDNRATAAALLLDAKAFQPEQAAREFHPEASKRRSAC